MVNWVICDRGVVVAGYSVYLQQEGLITGVQYKFVICMGHSVVSKCTFEHFCDWWFCGKIDIKLRFQSCKVQFVSVGIGLGGPN